MRLQKFELARFEGIFDQYGLATETEKRAGILCRRGESEMFTGRIEHAENLFRQARELAPQNAYVYALSASFELARYGVALSRAGETDRAIDVFADIIERERERTPPRDTLVMALKTRVINLRRAGRYEAAAGDLAMARTILANNPKLSHLAESIRELDEEAR